MSMCAQYVQKAYRTVQELKDTLRQTHNLSDLRFVKCDETTTLLNLMGQATRYTMDIEVDMAEIWDEIMEPKVVAALVRPAEVTVK